MGYVHIGHDCVVGNGAAIANCVQFAGHVKIAHRAIIGGGTLLAPFRRVGEGAMIGAVKNCVWIYRLMHGIVKA